MLCIVVCLLSMSSGGSLELHSASAPGGMADVERGGMDMRHSLMPDSGEQLRASFSSCINGVLPVDKQPLFERMLFRVSRGNAFTHFFPITEDLRDPVSNEPVKKYVFSVVFVGDQLRR